MRKDTESGFNEYAEPLGSEAKRAKSTSDELPQTLATPGNSMKANKSKLGSSAQKSVSTRKRSKANQYGPGSIQPMLSKVAPAPFNNDEWIFEPKLDGIRALAFIRGDEVTLLSRRNLDLTERFSDVVDALQLIDHNLILDGEITAIDQSGHPSFQLLQRAGQVQNSKTVRIIYYVFDILFAGDELLIDLSLKERRAKLREFVEESDVIKIVRDLGSNGILAFEMCVEHDLEGIMAKKLTSKYLPGHRSGDWLKIKSFKSTEFIICGYSAGTGSRDDSFGSLILGYYNEHGELTYAGSVGTGFNKKILDDLMKRMKPYIRKDSVFKKKIVGKTGITWVDPKLVAEIKFTEWTNDRILRIPVFLRLRTDIPPEEVKGK